MGTRSSLWSHRDFLKLWGAETISQFGTQISLIALPLAAVNILDASAFEMGVLTGLETIAFLLISLPAGVWVDRGRKRRFLVAGDVGRALALATLPLAYVAGWLSMPLLYAVALITGVFTVFFDAAYQAYLPALVEPKQLVEGNSKLETSRSAAAVFGPGLGGLLVQWLKAPIAIAFDALSFLFSAAFLWAIRRPEPAPPAVEQRPGMRREIAEGLGVIFKNPTLRGIAGSTGTSNLFGSMNTAVFVLFAVRELGLTAGSLGLVFGIGNVGFLFGAVIAGRLARWAGLGRTVIVSILFSGLAQFGLLAATKDNALPVLAGVYVIGAFTSVVYNIGQVSYRQTIVPLRLQGRMNASMRFLVWGTMPIGALIGGAVGTEWGLRAAIAVSAIGMSTAFLWVLLSPMRSIKEQPEPLVEAEPPVLPGPTSGSE